jgi:inositol-phosphate phosphatase/L-galactose 1-phosphate phosphatase/histidinol-phosphatase
MSEYRDFVFGFLDKSEEIVRKYFRNPDLVILEKEDESPVTVADREVERLFRDEVEKVFSEHDVFGEEFKNVSRGSDYKWFIDPIDGTSSFVSGKPLFTTLVALSYKGEVIYSVVNAPALGERYESGDGVEVNLNGKEIRVRDVNELKDAVLSTTSPYLFGEQDRGVFERVKREAKYQKYGGVFCGGDAYQYAMLASGNLEVVMEAGLSSYDFMALIPLVKNAGGVITDWEGIQLNENSDGRVLASCSQNIHDEILKLLIG